MSHLINRQVNLGQVREASRRQLLKCIDKCAGSKDPPVPWLPLAKLYIVFSMSPGRLTLTKLAKTSVFSRTFTLGLAIIWDDTLTGPVGLIAEYSLLKEHDVGKMFPLSRGRLQPCEEQNIIFLVRPRLEIMDIIAENILKEDGQKNVNKEYHIFFVPRKSMLCEMRLQKLGVYGSFTVKDKFDLSLIPFDSDLMSLEQDKCIYECHLENDLTSMYNAANSLMTLQTLFGIIPKIYGKGELAKHVCDIILRKRKEMTDVESQTPLIDNLVLIDRNVDFITPLLTQLTYEGLIDENFKIENTNCQLPPDKFPAKDESKTKQSSAETSKPKVKKVVLNSSDSLFAEIRDMNFAGVGTVLSREAKRITTLYEEHRSGKTVAEMKEFVHKLPHLTAAKTALALHTSIAEVIKEQTDSEDFRESLRVEQEFFNGIDTDKAHPYIEKCIGMKEPLSKVLRLVCLQCLVNNGFKQKVLDYYRREIVHTYGFEQLLTLSNLENIGLLRLSGPRTYPMLKKSLKLVVDDVKEQLPTDIAYVHSGYAPLSVRLAQYLERQSGWRGLEEVLKNLPGPTFEEKQHIPPALLKKAQVGGVGGSHYGGPTKVTLVYFLGGCTYSEVAALRFLAQQENATTDYIIATTKIINSKEMIGYLTEKVEIAPVNG